MKAVGKRTGLSRLNVSWWEEKRRTSHKDKYEQEYQTLFGGDGKLQGSVELLRGNAKEMEKQSAPNFAPMQKS